MAAHIIVYDHTPALLARFSYALLQAGYKATTRHPGQLSIGQVQALGVDLIIYGYTITSKTSELDFVPRLRAEAKTAHLPVIIATPEEQGINVSFDDDNTYFLNFCLEPFDVSRVMAKVTELVGPVETVEKK